MPDLLFWQCRCYPGCRSTKGRLLQPNPCFSWQMLLFLARIVPYTVALPSKPIARLLLHLTTLRGADYLFLSSRMQSAFTSSPTHQDRSGVKQYQYLRHASGPARNRNWNAFVYSHPSNRADAKHGRMGDCGRTDVWILSDAVSCTTIT